MFFFYFSYGAQGETHCVVCSIRIAAFIFKQKTTINLQRRFFFFHFLSMLQVDCFPFLMVVAFVLKNQHSTPSFWLPLCFLFLLLQCCRLIATFVFKQKTITINIWHQHAFILDACWWVHFVGSQYVVAWSSSLLVLSGEELAISSSKLAAAAINSLVPVPSSTSKTFLQCCKFSPSPSISSSSPSRMTLLSALHPDSRYSLAIRQNLCHHYWQNW